ncbi:aspartate/glutamate racemase family protein [Marinactinospora rubrisoli]|uniref:Aspartate/glutamate racemase family protein n=1 Tax=Marinactinospora rubrisoli TaxID=2715399 RepID=A0ABW2KJ14_9ACTN
MRILLVNPNRITACTDLLAAQAGRTADPGTEVTAVSPRSGPVELSGRREVLLSAAGVLDTIERLGGGADAIVLAGFGEPGQEAARELVGVPVLDITECGPVAAMLLGREYAVVTSTQAAVPIVEERLRELRLDGRCRTVRAAGPGVPGLVGGAAVRARAVEAVASAADGAPGEVIVLGCAAMTGLAHEVAATIDRPVVDPVAAAVRMAEALWRMDAGGAASATEGPAR